MFFCVKNTIKRRGQIAIISSIFLFIVLWYSYRVAFEAPFYLDTWAHLQDKTNLHLTELSWQRMGDAVRLDYGEKIYRPLSNLSLALTYYIAGLSPRAYRIGNVAIHWVSTLALTFLFIACLKAPRVSRTHPSLAPSALWISFLGASLWSLHPVQTNVVTYVIQRMTSLAGLFTFLSVGAYVRARSTDEGWSWLWGTGAIISLVLATASKENAAVIPGLALLAEWLLLVPPLRPKVRRLLAAAYSCGALCTFILLAWKGPVSWTSLQAGYHTRPFTMSMRLLTEARLQIQYLLVLLVPDPRLLTLDADVEVSRSLFQPPATAVGISLIVGAGTVAFLLRRKNPLLALGVLWFLLAQSVESTILPLELYFEHRLYVPSVFLYLGFSIAAFWAFQQPGLLRATASAAVAGALGVAVWATYSRNLTWSNPVAFWDDAVAKAPGKGRPRLNLGMALVNAGLYEEARDTLLIAERLGAGKPLTYYNLADIATRLGREEEACRYLLAVTTYKGDYAWKANGWLALKALKKGELQRARKHLTAALGEKPTDAELWRLAGELSLQLGKRPDAVQAFGRSLRLDPGQPEVRRKMSNLLRADPDVRGMTSRAGTQ